MKSGEKLKDVDSINSVRNKYIEVVVPNFLQFKYGSEAEMKIKNTEDSIKMSIYISKERADFLIDVIEPSKNIERKSYCWRSWNGKINFNFSFVCI